MSASAYPVIAPNIAVVERPNTKIFAARAGRSDFFVVCDATDVAGESPDAGAVDWRSDFSCSNMARRSTDLRGCDLVTCGLSTEGGVGGAHGWSDELLRRGSYILVFLHRYFLFMWNDLSIKINKRWRYQSSSS